MPDVRSYGRCVANECATRMGRSAPVLAIAPIPFDLGSQAFDHEAHDHRIVEIADERNEVGCGIGREHEVDESGKDHATRGPRHVELFVSEHAEQQADVLQQRAEGMEVGDVGANFSRGCGKDASLVVGADLPGKAIYRSRLIHRMAGPS